MGEEGVLELDFSSNLTTTTHGLGNDDWASILWNFSNTLWMCLQEHWGSSGPILGLFQDSLGIEKALSSLRKV